MTPERSEKRYAPRTVEKDGKNFLVVVMSDLDGTVNNEFLPESERLQSSTPAKDAFKIHEERGETVGIFTARSIGEAVIYADFLEINGPIQGENGAVVWLPHMLLTKAKEKFSDYQIEEFHSGSGIILSKITKKEILEFIKYQEEKHNITLINSITSSAQELQEHAGHHTLEMAEASKQRLASAYAVTTSVAVQESIIEDASKFGIYAFGEKAINLVGKDVSKGDALQFVADHAQVIYPTEQPIHGVIPIVYGNGNNDIPLFTKAHELGGIGIIVPSPRGFSVPEINIPATVMKANKPNAQGIAEMQQAASEFINK